jgi:hypothetical protein
MPLPQVEQILKFVAMARSRFLYGLDQTPDDRLNWSPGGDAPSPLQLAGKLTGFLDFMVYMLENASFPERGEPGAPPATRAEAKQAVDARFTRLIDQLKGFTESDLQKQVPAPWRAMVPLDTMLPWVSAVIAYHQGQFNLIQLAYGDKDPNVPPEWGSEVA